jgi:heme-degrading monooxygenase HmoA
MFLQQDGFMGCVMFRNESEAMVLTLWRDAVAIATLERSPSYAETVGRLLGAGILSDPQAVTAGTIHLMELRLESGSLGPRGRL